MGHLIYSWRRQNYLGPPPLLNQILFKMGCKWRLRWAAHMNFTATRHSAPSTKTIGTLPADIPAWFYSKKPCLHLKAYGASPSQNAAQIQFSNSPVRRLQSECRPTDQVFRSLNGKFGSAKMLYYQICILFFLNIKDLQIKSRRLGAGLGGARPI